MANVLLSRANWIPLFVYGLTGIFVAFCNVSAEPSQSLAGRTESKNVEENLAAVESQVLEELVDRSVGPRPSKDQCLELISGCINCDSVAGKFTCNECGLYTGLSNGVCKPCSPGCKSCRFQDENGKSNELCTGCLPVYYPLASANTGCGRCPDGCLSCRNGGEGVGPLCQQCFRGYTFVNGACRKCQERCDACSLDENQLQKCDSCSVGYGITTNPATGKSTCAPCPPTCVGRCEFDPNNQMTRCTDCARGLGGARCTILCGENCTVCSSSPVKCDSCKPGFFLSEDGRSCVNCDRYGPKPYCADCGGGLTCRKCDMSLPVENRAYRSESSYSECEQLQPPYCVQFDPSTVAKVGCLKCVPGYYVTSDGRCLKSPIDGCRDYNGNANKCDFCEKGRVPSPNGQRCLAGCPEDCGVCEKFPNEAAPRCLICNYGTSPDCRPYDQPIVM